MLQANQWQHLACCHCKEDQRAWRPSANAIKILTSCFSTASMSVLSTPSAMAHYGKTWRRQQNRKYITFIPLLSEEDRATATGHSHVQKISWSLDVWFLRHPSRDQTYSHAYRKILRTPTGGQYIWDLLSKQTWKRHLICWEHELYLGSSDVFMCCYQ